MNSIIAYIDVDIGAGEMLILGSPGARKERQLTIYVFPTKPRYFQRGGCTICLSLKMTNSIWQPYVCVTLRWTSNIIIQRYLYSLAESKLHS